MPTAPVPKTATAEPGLGWSTLSTAPAPVMMPQPRGPRISSGASSGTLTTPWAGAFVCSAKADCPKKCEPIGPSASENALEPSSRSTPKFLS